MMRMKVSASSYVEERVGLGLNQWPCEVSDVTLNDIILELIEPFCFPVFVVSNEGIILALNSTAVDVFDIGEGASVNRLPYLTDTNVSLSSVLGETLRVPEDQNNHKYLKVLNIETEISEVLVLSSYVLANPSYQLNLLSIAVTPWNERIQKVFQKSFELSKAEISVLQDYFRGKSLKEIAHLDGKSLGTVKLQLHSVFDKVGAEGRVDLMRKVASSSHYLQEANQSTKSLKFPYRKELSILRPDKTSAEFTLSGDFSGDALVFLPSLLICEFPSRLEKRLFEKGLCLITPSTRAMDLVKAPSLEEYTYSELSKDLRTLFRLLKVESAQILGHGTSNKMAIVLAGALSDMVENVTLTSVFEPSPSHNQVNLEPLELWPLLERQCLSPERSAFIFRYINKINRSAPIKKSNSNPLDRLNANPSRNHELVYQDAMETAIKSFWAQQEQHAFKALELCLTDWSASLATCAADVSILTSKHATNRSSAFVQSLAKEHNDKIKVIETNCEADMLPYSAFEDLSALTRQSAKTTSLRIARGQD
ncbi:MAG: hypothetical protein AAGF53_02525 [Pseudomonadota bacterium]